MGTKLKILFRTLALSGALVLCFSPLVATDVQARGLVGPRALAKKVSAYYASAIRGLRARVADFKVIRMGKATGSIEGFRQHSRFFSQASNIHMDKREDRRGRTTNIAPRQASEVLSSKRGLRRYLAFVGKSTVELIYKDNSSNGHLMIRAGTELYEFNGKGSARKMPFIRKLRGESEWVGMVYEVDHAQLGAIQTELAAQVTNTVNHYLPPFDGGGRPTRLERQLVGFTVASTAKDKVATKRKVDATLLRIGDSHYLQTPLGYKVPARIKGDLVEVDSLNCTSFPILTLARLLPGRGFDQLHKYTQTRATNAVSNIVRGTTKAMPDLVTVYRTTPAMPQTILERLWHVGKTDPA
jgi:hypothetical protein